jgi:hypothetical protein
MPVGSKRVSHDPQSSTMHGSSDTLVIGVALVTSDAPNSFVTGWEPGGCEARASGAAQVQGTATVQGTAAGSGDRRAAYCAGLGSRGRLRSASGAGSRGWRRL